MFIAKTIIFINFQLCILCSKILIWNPTPSKSHQNFYYPIVRELALRGHQVTFITTDPLNEPDLINLTEINTNFVYNIFKNHNSNDYGIFQHKIVTSCSIILPKILKVQLNNSLVQEALFKNSYDLFISEFNFYVTLTLLKQYYKCSVIALTTLSPQRVGYQLIGDIVNPSYEGYFLLDFNRPKTFLQRFINTYIILWDYFMWENYLLPNQKQVLKKYFNDKIENYDAELKVDLILSNTHPILTGARSNYPTVIEIGGLSTPRKKTLSKVLKNFLDSSNEGVIYFSLGSRLQSKLLPNETKKIILETFRKLSINVLWKFEDEIIENKPDNVFIWKWVPQIDVLNHPNVKLFITQGGLQSLEETLHAKVPIIGIPMYGDQYWNIDHMVNNLKIGVYIDIKSITIEKFCNAIQRMWKNESYNENIVKANKLLLDAPITALDKAIYWIEFLIRHKNTSFLESPKLKMSIFEYFLLDVILFSITILTLILSILYIILIKLLKFVFKVKCKKSKND